MGHGTNANDPYQPAATQGSGNGGGALLNFLGYPVVVRPAIVQARPGASTQTVNLETFDSQPIKTESTAMTPDSEFAWQQGLVIPISIQLPQMTGPQVQFASGRKINRPFIVRGVLVQVNIPTAQIYIRAGYGPLQPQSLADLGSCFNIFSGFGFMQTAASNDAIAAVIAGALITPLYIPVDTDQSFLWANIEGVGVTSPTQAVVTFFCDFTPDPRPSA